MPQPFELKQVRVQLREAPPIYSTSQITSPEDAVKVMSETLAMMDREYCCVVNLDNRNRPINYNVVSIGDVNSAMVPIQNVFKSAILSNAASIMLFHNHPSGELTPSREDEILTEKLIYAGKIMNINVVDHVIVGGEEGKHYSFREGEGFLFDAEPGMENGMVLDSKSMKDQLKEITDRLEAGIEEIFTSNNYKNYLDTMAKFHKYSFNNTLLIALQNPEATLVAGYDAWKRKFHRQVKKGEKSIKIIAPMTFRRDMEVEKVDPATREIIIGADGQPEKETKQVSYQRFKVSSVFDVSQTFGDPIPSLEVPELTGNAEGFDVFMEAVRKAAPVPIRFDEVPGEAKGYYDNGKKEIVIRKDMSQSQTMKTAVHELGHSLCHDRDFLQSLGEKKDRVTMELEAESIANCVCAYFGLDTSDYSYPYIAGWAADRPRNVLQESMDMIRTTSGQIIEQMMEVFKEHDLVKGQDLDVDLINDFYEIYQIDPDGKARDQMFLGYGYLEDHGLTVNPEDYNSVYRGELQEKMTLEGLYEKFNLFRPEDFKGHSLSVGDVVLMSQSGKRQAWFVDTIGFKEISGFDKGTELMPDARKKQAVTEKGKTNIHKVKKEAVLCR